MTNEVFVQSILDGLLLSLCCLGLLGRAKGKMNFLSPLLFSGICFLARLGLGQSYEEIEFAVLPVNNIVTFLFLFLAVLILNSLWFRKREGQTFFGTVAAFGLFLLLREFSLVVLFLCGLTEPIWYLYVGRVLPLLLWLALGSTGAFGWLAEKLDDGDITIYVVGSNTTLLLLLILAVFQFNLPSMLQRFPIMLGALGLLVLGNGIVLFFQQQRAQARKRTALLEQYLPLVEELIEQVRARQHDFNNQMMAVSAAISSANDLREAQESVSLLLQNIRLDSADKELLKCDSKVISGVLFGKMKQAELRRVCVNVTVAGAFLHRSLSEADWVEVIAVLLDNAIEAASSGDTVFVKAAEESGKLRFSVSNPHSPLSNIEFMQMFRRGWSTKQESGHGYGLHNVRQIVERHGGKIVTGNERLMEIPYITIGILVS